MTNYFYDEPRSNGIYSRNNLPKVKDRAFVINLHDKNSKAFIGFHYLSTKI